jgi:Spy/CpxP family protein refolding chaperone
MPMKYENWLMKWNVLFFAGVLAMPLSAMQPGNPPGGIPGGPPGGFGPFQPPRPGEILPGFLQDQLKLTVEQKKKLGELQKDVEANLAKLLTAEQKKALDEIRQGKGAFGFGPPGFGPPGFGPPGGAPGGPPPKMGFGGPPGFGGFGMGRADDVQKKISATDEEWKVIGPKLQKVIAARRAVSGEAVPGPMSGTAVAQAQSELKTVLDDPKHTKAEVDEKITAVRKARERARTDLEEAQRDLVRMLTPTQQAILVSLGHLD